MQIIPTKRHILAEPITENRELAGGLVLPEFEKSKPERFVVIAIGPKVKGVEIGDTILAEWEELNFTQDGKKLAIISDTAILAILRD